MKNGATSINCSWSAVCSALVFSLFLCGQPAPAQETSSTVTVKETAPPTTSAPATAPSAPAPLQGKVQKVELSLEKLRDVGQDLKHVLKAASSLFDEVTMQPVRIITQPEVVAGGTIINIPISTQPVGPAVQPRKERVDVSMNELRTVISMMKKTVDEFVGGELQFDLPDSVKQQLKPEFSDWVIKVDSMAAQETELEKYTQGPPYDNKTIATLSARIDRDVKDLDKTRREIYKVVRKEGKRIQAYTENQ